MLSALRSRGGKFQRSVNSGFTLSPKPVLLYYCSSKMEILPVELMINPKGYLP